MTTINPPPLVGQIYQFHDVNHRIENVDVGGHLLTVRCLRDGNQVNISRALWDTATFIKLPGRGAHIANECFTTEGKVNGVAALYFDRGNPCLAAYGDGGVLRPHPRSKFGMESTIVPDSRLNEVADWVAGICGGAIGTEIAERLGKGEVRDFPSRGENDRLVRSYIPDGVFVLMGSNNRLSITSNCKCDGKGTHKDNGCHPHVSGHKRFSTENDALLNRLTKHEIRSMLDRDGFSGSPIGVVDFRGDTEDGAHKSVGVWANKEGRLYLPKGVIDLFIDLRDNYWRKAEAKEVERQKKAAQADPVLGLDEPVGIVNPRAINRLVLKDPTIAELGHVCPRCNGPIGMPAHHGNAYCKCGWPHGAKYGEPALEKFVRGMMAHKETSTDFVVEGLSILKHIDIQLTALFIMSECRDEELSTMAEEMRTLIRRGQAYIKSRSEN